MEDIRNMSDESKAVHAGITDNEHLAVVPPVYMTSTFKFRDADHGARLFQGKEDGFIYTRMLNPTVKAFEDAMAVLENGHKGLACGSGMAAIHTVFAAYLSQGDHVICSSAVYGPTNTLLAGIHTRFGVEPSFIDTFDLTLVEAAFQPNTKMVYIETPGNPTLAISDIAAIAKMAHDRGAILVVDNTFMSPILQRPLDLGADIVIHSLTKFLNGHADVVGGVIVCRDETQYKTLRSVLNQLGGTLPPFEAFLVHRGLKTLALRMERHSTNGQKVAEFLEAHDAVDRVYYPGLSSHPQFEVGQRQMTGSSGMIAFELKSGLEAGKKVMNSVKLCQLAVSLGGVETLIQHPASMTHASMGREQRLNAHITDGLVRISVGIENVVEIIADLKHALLAVVTDM